MKSCGLPGLSVTSSGDEIGAIDVGGDRNPLHHDSGAIPELTNYAINFDLSEASRGFCTDR